MRSSFSSSARKYSSFLSRSGLGNWVNMALSSCRVRVSPATLAGGVGSSLWLRCYCQVTEIGQHHDSRSDAYPAVKIDHVSVEHADAPARYFVADRFRHGGAVNTIARAAEV